MNKVTINAVFDNLTNIIFLMNTVAMVGCGNTQQSVQGDEVASLLLHFSDQLTTVKQQLAELTQAVD